MLEGYIDFARSEAAEDTGDLDLNALFSKLEAEAGLRGKSMQAAIAGDPVVRVRPAAFARLVANLAGNAFRYASNVKLSAVHAKGSLMLTIDDDGPGIPEDQRERVFKPFVRLDEARNLDESGTGLGLAIARDIARSHGGDITLDNSPMGGLRAIVRVPA